jgi:hypothetical protein
MSEEELLCIDGGGIVYDIGYLVGGAIKNAYTAGKDLATQALNPWNYINYAIH